MIESVVAFAAFLAPGALFVGLVFLFMYVLEVAGRPKKSKSAKGFTGNKLEPPMSWPDPPGSD